MVSLERTTDLDVLLPLTVKLADNVSVSRRTRLNEVQ